jgi:hypothetical protein
MSTSNRNPEVQIKDEGLPLGHDAAEMTRTGGGGQPGKGGTQNLNPRASEAGNRTK